MYIHQRMITPYASCVDDWRIIMWIKPAAIEMRYGFEVTMYVMNK